MKSNEVERSRQVFLCRTWSNLYCDMDDVYTCMHCFLRRIAFLIKADNFCKKTGVHEQSGPKK